MAFKGMNPEDGRQVAQQIKKTGSDIQDVYDQITSIVTSVEWVGPDYDNYTSDWNSFISGRLGPVVEAFNAKGDDLNTQADQQDDTSNQD